MHVCKRIETNSSLLSHVHTEIGIAMGKRIRDIIKEVPAEKVPGLLAQKRGQITNFLEQVKANKERTDENLLYFRCLAKACQLIDHFKETWRKDFLLGCVLTRSMFELDLLIRWFEADPEKRQQFYNSAMWEECDLLEAFLEFDQTGLKGKPMRERLRQLEGLKKKCGLDRRYDRIGKISWKGLAKRFGVLKDYKTIYSLSSKILHISPYSVLRDLTENDIENTWKVLLVMMQLFLGDIYFRISRFFEMTPV